MDSFLFLGAGTPWVSACAEALAHLGHSVTSVALNDWRQPAGKRKPFGAVSIRQVMWTMPPGYVGSLKTVCAPWLRSKLRREVGALKHNESQGDVGHPWVIVPYPWFEAFASQVPDGRLIYYHYDDYQLFRPERRVSILSQQRLLVERSALTLCSSQQQQEALQKRYPAQAKRIRHFSHGVVARFINPAVDPTPPGRVVGYVGNLIDRVDWRLVAAVAKMLPDVEFIFVGELADSGDGGARPSWQADRQAALALPNVWQIGPVPQDAVAGHYWSFRLSWIPYATDHAFNQASSPTKIMDGLAAGRPMFSTDIPECRLYPQWVTVVHSPEEMAAQIARGLNEPDPSERAHAQVEFARRNTWEARAETLLRWLGDSA